MLKDIDRVLRQLDDRRLWKVLGKAVIATLVLLLLVVGGLTVLVDMLAATGIGWLDVLLPWLTGIGGLVIAFLLLPLVTVSVLGLFVDEVAAAVEDRWYPGSSPAAAPGLVAGLLQALRLLAVTLALNLLVLPLYVLLPGANVVLFLLLNGYLLGREYFETVASRRATPAEAARLRRAHRGRAFAAGVAIAGLALVPVANFFVPVAGTALMVHRVQGLRATPSRATARRKT